MTDKKIVIITEKLTRSIAADIVTFVTLIGSVAIGKWIGSEALQWTAGLLVILVLIAIKPKYHFTFTSVDAAKAYLDTLK